MFGSCRVNLCDTCMSCSPLLLLHLVLFLCKHASILFFHLVNLQTTKYTIKKYFENVRMFILISVNVVGSLLLINILTKVLRIRSIFFGPGSADPVFQIRIQIRVTQKRPESTGSGSYLDMILMFSKIDIFYGILLPNLNML